MPDYALMNQYLYEGNAKEVEQMTKDALAEGRPVQEVLNDGLIAGMSVVGEDFKHNVIYVPEVLIAARAMKAGMAVLKPLLSAKDSDARRAGVLLMGALHLFIMKTRMGRAMRATALDKKAAGLMGVNIDGVISTTFVIGSFLAAVAGVMVAMYYGLVNFYIGYLAGMKAFTAAVLGGIGNVPGAMLGGFVLGILESVGAGYLWPEYKDAFAFLVLVLILIIRPQGLLGSRMMDKV